MPQDTAWICLYRELADGHFEAIPFFVMINPVCQILLCHQLPRACARLCVWALLSGVFVNPSLSSFSSPSPLPPPPPPPSPRCFPLTFLEQETDCQLSFIRLHTSNVPVQEKNPLPNKSQCIAIYLWPRELPIFAYSSTAHWSRRDGHRQLMWCRTLITKRKMYHRY